jgi:NAD(P)-dependent dehydrogenase (short-subunit alcohol dehydrogenase family)
MGKMNERAAIVTGATSGMGRATALLFAREGAGILASGRDEARGAALVDGIRAAGGRAEFVGGDVAEPETNEALVERCLRGFGRLDSAVACAGTLGLGPAAELALETWRRTMAVNLDAVFFLMRAALPAMAARGGTFVVVGSIAAYKGFPNHAAYCASKGALVSLVRQVAVDSGPKVRVNLICPGPVDTPLIHDSAAAFPDPAKAVEDAGRRTVMRRLGQPDDVARAALFLASDDSAWITGAALNVDGGVMTGA